jgi:hypothetical protein
MMVLLVIVLIGEGCRDTGLAFSPVMTAHLVIVLIWEGCRDKSLEIFKWGESELVLIKHYGCVHEVKVFG